MTDSARNIVEAVTSDPKWLGDGDTVIAALRSAGLLNEGWRPIESAPKDGRSILTLTNRVGHGMMIHYWGRRNSYEPPCWLTHPNNTNHIDQPTLWMPLPAELPPAPRERDMTPEQILSEALLSRDPCFSAQETDEHAAAQIAALAAHGMAVVPVEPTIEMSIAFAEVFYSKRRCIDDHDISDWYRAMLAAAKGER